VSSFRDARRRADVVQADETGGHIGCLIAWLWGFSQHQVTGDAIRQRRGYEVPAAIPGPPFDGWRIVDGFVAHTVREKNDRAAKQRKAPKLLPSRSWRIISWAGEG
jgi:hypothetical protein